MIEITIKSKARLQLFFYDELPVGFAVTVKRIGHSIFVVCVANQFVALVRQ